MSAQSFTAEQLRVYELQSLVSGLSEWQKSLDLPKQSPPFLHDAFLLPHDWRYRYAEFQKLYHAEESRCFQKLSEREPVDIFKWRIAMTNKPRAISGAGYFVIY